MVLLGAKTEHSLHNRDAQENGEEVFSVPTNNTNDRGAISQLLTRLNYSLAVWPLGDLIHLRTCSVNCEVVECCVCIACCFKHVYAVEWYHGEK